MAAEMGAEELRAMKFRVSFRPYPAGAGSTVHDELWTVEGNSLREALDAFYRKPDFNPEWRVVDVEQQQEWVKVSGETRIKELEKALKIAQLFGAREPRFPVPCVLCEQIIDGWDGTEGHGLGECVELCDKCDGSGSPDLAFAKLREKFQAQAPAEGGGNGR